MAVSCFSESWLIPHIKASSHHYICMCSNLPQADWKSLTWPQHYDEFRRRRYICPCKKLPQIHELSLHKPVFMSGVESGGAERARRRWRGEEVLRYLEQSSRAVAGLGLTQGHVKVECGWAGRWPEAVTVTRDNLPGNKVKSVSHPGEIIPHCFNTVCHYLATRQRLVFFVVLFKQNWSDRTREVRKFACCSTGQTIIERLQRWF